MLSLLLLFLLLLLLCFPDLHGATNFTYIGFEGATSAGNGPATSGIRCLQGASVVGSALQLTATDAIQGMGRCLYTSPIRFLDDSGKPVSFSTQFILKITAGSEDQSDGMAFVIAPSLEPVNGSSQGYLGLYNSSDANTNTTDATNATAQTLGIEFDTYKNPEFDDIDGNHVGIDVNSIISWLSVSSAFRTSNSSEINSAADGYSIQLKGSSIQAWIDFDSVSNRLEISVSRTVGTTRPQYALISNTSLNLSSVLNQNMYIGFTAATGPLEGVLYNVYSWSFSNEGNSTPITMPSSSSTKNWRKIALIVGVVIGALVLISLGIVSAFIYSRCRNRPFEAATDEQLGLSLDQNLPQRYSYNELSKATQNFHAKNLLGSGGFGSVYKGKIPSTLVEVAVKRISKGSKQGVKEFVSEVTTIGQLRHRNLAPLLGWCQEKGFMLVYELMPNGSLDQFLFQRDRREKLTWPMRLHILKGVSAAVNYLHEECEKKIVHRDIKASNVMLDAHMNARLGDFGLARLYGHDVAPGTTNVAGTWGYMAPESFYTRKATDKTDVFSFGVLVLEVVTGKKVSDYIEKEECALMEWLWKLHKDQRLIEAVDPSLSIESEEDKAMVIAVLELGLTCCYAVPDMRPSMRNVLHVLSGEAPPILLPPSISSPYSAPPKEMSNSYQASTVVSITSSTFSSET